MARRMRTAIAEPRGERPQASVAELEARLAALTAELGERTALVEIYRALGGGWQT